jgi:acetyl esterase/lipase
VIFVSANYRLSPAVQHPEHVKDVARAFAWTHKNIAKYGGRTDQIFVCGHSAGGHLAALLATDETYLKAEGLSLRDIKGAIPMSGVYRFDPIPVDLKLNFQLPRQGPAVGGDVSFKVSPWSRAFGTDPAGLKNAAPLTHVNPRCPPFRIIYADNDFPTCDKMSEDLAKALKATGCSAETRVIRDRDHFTIILKAVIPEDPASEAILEFIQTQTRR